MKTYSIKELKVIFSKGLETVKTPQSKSAYKQVLRPINRLDKIGYNVEVAVRGTANSLNIGDVMEALFKSYYFNEYATVELQGKTDLDRAVRNEVKALTTPNRSGGQMYEPYGFYAITKYGVFYIAKKYIAELWDSLRTYNSKKWLKEPQEKRPRLIYLKDIEYLINKYDIQEIQQYELLSFKKDNELNN